MAEFKTHIIKEISEMAKHSKPIYKIYCTVPVIGIYGISIKTMVFLMDFEIFKENTYESDEETQKTLWKNLIDPKIKNFKMDILGTLCYLNYENRNVHISEDDETESLDMIDIRIRKDKVELLN